MRQVVGLPNNSYKPITNTAWVRARLCKLQKGALGSQPQIIKLSRCLPTAESGAKHKQSINQYIMALASYGHEVENQNDKIEVYLNSIH